MRTVCFMTLTPTEKAYDHSDVAIPFNYIPEVANLPEGTDLKVRWADLSDQCDGFLKEMFLHEYRTEDDSLHAEELHVIPMLTKEMLEETESDKIHMVARELARQAVEPFGGEVLESYEGPLGPGVKVIGFDREMFSKVVTPAPAQEEQSSENDDESPEG